MNGDTMSDWIDVAAVGEFPAGASRVLYVEDVAIAVVNLDGQYHALENLCTHDNATLLDGSCDPEDLIDRRRNYLSPARRAFLPAQRRGTQSAGLRTRNCFPHACRK